MEPNTLSDHPTEMIMHGTFPTGQQHHACVRSTGGRSAQEVEKLFLQSCSAVGLSVGIAHEISVLEMLYVLVWWGNARLLARVRVLKKCSGLV